MSKLKPYAKAIVGALLAGGGVLYAGLDDGQVFPAEWVAVALAAITGLAGVYAVPNKPADQ